MADSVVKLKLDSGEYDSKIKRAAQNIVNFGENCKKAGQGVDKADKETLEYVRSLGRMETVAKNTKGKINEMTNAFTDLSVQYKHLTDQEKNSPFGKALAQSLDQLKGRIVDSKKELADFNRQLEITSANSLKVKPSKSIIGDNLLNAVGGQFGLSSSMLSTAGATVAGAGLAMKLVGDNVETALNFEKSVSQLSSLTGKVGDDLKKLKEYAIDLGSTTTLSASEVADAFKMIGSQMPQLLESSEALRDVTASAIMLSEAAGIDLATAAQTLSTSINQFGGDAGNAERFVNVLAAASQKGAGDISFLGEAISKSGVLANSVGVSYEELVANLEQLAQAGIDASTSGTALRSIIANLEKQSNNDYKPSVVGLTEAFHNLNEAHLSTVDYVDLAGKQFFSQAMILAENADKAKILTAEITGTSTAEDQARINTDNLEGSLKSLSSAWEGLNLHINSSNGLLRNTVDTLKNVVTAIDKAVVAFQDLMSWLPKVDLSLFDFIAPTAPFSLADKTANWLGGQLGIIPQNEPSKTSSTGGGGSAFARGGSASAVIAGSGGRTGGGGGGGRSGGGRGGGRTGGRGGGGRSTGVKQETPQERAEKQVAAALANYQKTITEASWRFEAGLDDQMAYSKKELAAQDRLTNAYADAYAIHADPKYKAAFNESAEKYLQLSESLEKMKKLFDDNIEEQKRDNPVTLEGSIRQGLQQSIQDADMNALTNLMKLKIEHGLENIDIPAELLQKAILGDGMEPIDIPDEYWQALAAKINEGIANLGIDPYVLDVKTGNITKAAKETEDGWQEAARAVQAVGGALQQLEDPSAKIAGIIGQAIANIALGFAQATAKTGAAGGIFGWIAAIAGGIGTMVSTISAIKSATAGSYAEGGIIPGHDYNDGMIAAVSSGELILNRAQQGVIASQLSDTRGGVDRQPYLDVETIWLGLGHFLKRRDMGEIVTTKG